MGLDTKVFEELLKRRGSSAPMILAAVLATALTTSQIDAVLAHAHAAAGGRNLDRFVFSRQAGNAVQGGAPLPFVTDADLRTGYFRQQLTVGPATILQGYDGAEWSMQNGALSIVSLPSFVADAVTQAYLNSNAFLRADKRKTIVSGRKATIDKSAVDVLHVTPAGGSPADLYFDGTTYRLVRVVAYQAGGVDTTTYSNFQSIQGVPTAMKSVEVNPSGTKTSVTLTSVRYATRPNLAALARPPFVYRGNLTTTVSVPFQSDEVGATDHLVVPVTLGTGQATMIFDSGGANFLVDTAAQRLGLKSAGDFAIGGVGSKEQMSQMAAVPIVDFGGAKLEHQNFVVTPLLYPLVHPRKGMVIDGLIGYEYLANYRVSVRYADGRIDIAPFDAPPPSGGVTLPLLSDGGHAYVKARVDGVSGYYLLDTGNGGGVDLNGPFVEEHHLFANGGVKYVSPGGVGGAVQTTETAAKTFELAGVTFKNVPVAIVRSRAGAFATHGVAGNLGARILSRFTVIFDYKAQTVTFIPNAGESEGFSPDRTGLSLNQSGPSAFEVLAVVPNSPAAAAGIAAGDKITGVNDTAVSSGLGLGDLRKFTRGEAPFTLTFERDSQSRTVTITPRSMLPAPQ